MILITNKQNCCGCTACHSICTHHAIILKPDELGFMYPMVNEQLCVGCQLCEEVCPMQHRDEDRNTPSAVLAVRHRNAQEIDRSRSGAAFWALAQVFVNKGCIYGACFETPSHIIHSKATTLDECQKFRGSKYAQSDLTGIFAQIKHDLAAGLEVMFTGTPCQVVGLKRFIPIALADKLTTVDLVCHGCASPKVWRENIRFIERKYGAAVISANFRDKKYGWRRTVETYKLANGEEKSSSYFSQLFDKELIERDSCEQCSYTNLRRCGDLTIGDFWKWYKISDEWNDDRGVSMVMINTAKGEELFDKAKEHLFYRESNTRDCLQPQLEHPLQFNPTRDKFICDFATSGYEYAISQQSLTGWKAFCRGARITIIGKIVEAKNWLTPKKINHKARCN